MTLVQLRHLIALAETGSFSQSAARVHLTQPALSRSIRALEDELGHPLFDRVGRHIELTTYGQHVVARARQLVVDAEELRDSGRLMREGEAGLVRIGLGSGPSALLKSPLMLRMATQYPRVRVDIAVGSTEQLVQALRDHALDALVIDARAMAYAPDLHVATLVEMRGAFMCRPDHPLLTGSTVPVSFDRVRQYPIASTPLSDEVARLLVERYGPAAHPISCVTLRCEEIASLVEVVRASDAVLLAIRASAPDLVELTLDPPLQASARFGLVTRAGRAEAPALPIVKALVAEWLHD